MLEICKPQGMAFKYLIVSEKEVMKGVIYLQELHIVSSHFDGTVLDKQWLTWLKKCINNQFSDVLICGNLFRIHFPGYFFKDPLDEPLIFDLLTDYLNADKRNNRFCGILLKDCPRTFSPRGKFKPYRDDVTMELVIRPEWKSFEDYTKMLSKKYLQRCKKIRKAAEALVVKELDLEQIIEGSSRIEELYRNVALKQSFRIGLVNAAYFSAMKRKYGRLFKFRAYYLQNHMVAFSTYIYYPDDSMEIHFIGIDYTVNETYSLYFNILFDGAEEAMIRGCKRLELGRTARTAKASLGAEAVQVHNYIFLKKGIPSLAFSFFNTWFVNKMGEEWMDRKPFKEIK